jgi:hypothetical protein
MAQQYGFRASNNLLEVLDRNACWDNLGIDRRDLLLLVGTSAAGVVPGDYQAIIGLTGNLESQIVATASGASVLPSSLSLKLSKNGDTVLGNLFANIVNNDRPYFDAGNTIYGPSTASFFSPANASGFSSGAQYKLGPVKADTTTVSGLNYTGIAPLWSDYFVRYKQYLQVQEQPSWTVRRSPLYLPPPSTISSNVLWLDAEYSSFDLDGSAVGQWRDVLGRAGAVQLTAASKPSLVPNRRNNKPGVVFDGSNDFLSFGDLSGQFPSAATVIVVATLGETPARGDADYNLIGTFNNGNNRWRGATGNGAFGLFSSAVLTGFPETMPANGTYVFSVQASQALGITLRTNSLETHKRSNQFATNFTYNAGTVYTIGANAGGNGGFFAGTMYAVAMFNAILSEKELRTMEEYFAWRFDAVYDPDRSQTVELEDETLLTDESSGNITLG